MLQDLEPDPEGDAASGHPGKLHLLKDVSGVFKPRVLTCLMVSPECDAMVMLPCEATCVMHGHSASPYGCKQSSPTKTGIRASRKQGQAQLQESSSVWAGYGCAAISCSGLL